MAELVPIPWQPSLYLRPETLALLVAVSDRLNTRLQIMAPDGAWRSYARQKYYYDLYKAGKGNPAANPDNPNVQNNHRRGAAFDLIRTDKTVQAACSAVGLIRDAAETWHWNHPYAYRYAVIDNFSAVAGGGATIITEPEDLEMGAYRITSPAGISLSIDGVLAQGDNTPSEFAAAKGFTDLTMSAAQHRSFLANAAAKHGVPLLVRINGEAGVYAAIPGEGLRGLRPTTLSQLQQQGAPEVTIDSDEVSYWLNGQ